VPPSRGNNARVHGNNARACVLLSLVAGLACTSGKVACAESTAISDAASYAAAATCTTGSLAASTFTGDPPQCDSVDAHLNSTFESISAGILLAESPVAPRLLDGFLSPGELAWLNAMVADLSSDDWWPCSAASDAGHTGKECALLEVRPNAGVLQSAMGRIGEMWGIDINVAALPLFRYLPGPASLPPHVDRMADGRIPDASLIVYLSGAPAGHGRTLFPALSLTVEPTPGALLSWRNTDGAGRPHADALHEVETPASSRAVRVAVQLPLMLNGAGGVPSRVLPIHFGLMLPSPSPPPSPPPSPSVVACPGPVTIVDPGSYAAAAMCITIAADLTVSEFFLGSSVVLPLLGSVGGSFTAMDNAQLTSVGLPSLRTVGGTIAINFNSKLFSVDMPLLDRVIVGHITLYRNPLLAWVWPLLRSVGGGTGIIDIIDNDNLVSVDPPQLSVACCLTVISNPKLASLKVPQLSSLAGGGILLALNRQLASVDLPLLGPVASVLVLSNLNLVSLFVPLLNFPEPILVNGAFEVRGNPKLAVLDVPRLSSVSDFFDVSSNDNLKTLNFPSLVFVVDDFQVYDNAKLFCVDSRSCRGQLE